MLECLILSFGLYGVWSKVLGDHGVSLVVSFAPSLRAPKGTINCDQLYEVAGLILITEPFRNRQRTVTRKLNCVMSMSLSVTDPRLIALSLAALLILALEGLLFARKRRRAHVQLNQQFGPEYKRAFVRGMAHKAGTGLDNCAKIKDLGFKASARIKMYGESFEIVSDPFKAGDCIAVRATSGNSPEIRTVLLPIAILLGIADRFLKLRV